MCICCAGIYKDARFYKMLNMSYEILYMHVIHSCASNLNRKMHVHSLMNYVNHMQVSRMFRCIKQVAVECNFYTYVCIYRFCSYVVSNLS